MRGPGLRTSYDVRRLWKCPECGKTRRSQGRVTAMVCSCQSEPVFMNLVEQQRPHRASAESMTLYLEFTEEELAAVTLKPPKPRPQPEAEEASESKSGKRRDHKGRKKKRSSKPDQQDSGTTEEE